MPALRTIFHVDMDAFFAAAEVLDFPELAGKPVLVGFDGPRGVVSTASYEARRFGCHSAMPMSIARRRCPQAIIRPVRGSRYRELSQQVFDIFDRFTPVVQPLSVDEAFLDMTGSERLFTSPVAAANQLRAMIHDEVGMTASVGVAPNKFVAKLASEFHKPDRLTVVSAEETEAWVGALPIERMWGVGPATLAKMSQAGVGKIGDLWNWSEADFSRRLSDASRRFAKLSRGVDDRPVTPDHQAKSVSQEHTFGVDVGSPEEVRRVLMAEVEQVATRLRRHRLKAQAVTLKIRYGDFHTITRSRTLPFAEDSTSGLGDAAIALWNAWAGSSFQPVRLIGFGGSNLSAGGQIALFEDAGNQKLRKADEVSDQIRERFGKKSIHRGWSTPRVDESDG